MRAQIPRTSEPSHPRPRRLADERGMSLMLALGFLVIFTISTTAIVNELVLNESGAKRDQAMLTALGAAEAEMNFAQQWVEANDPLQDKPERTAFPTAPTPRMRARLRDTCRPRRRTSRGTPVAGATHYGWWAHKYATRTARRSTRPLRTGTYCWLVDGRARSVSRRARCRCS